MTTAPPTRRPLGYLVLMAAASVLSLPTAVGAQQHGLRFDQISIRQGLSQRIVTAILQDRTGFMWFGTQGGLNRYDGHQFVVLEYHPGDSTSLADNYVKALHEDARGRLWVGTQTGGLGLLNERHDAFRNYRHRDDDPTSLSNDAVYSIAEDAGGTLFVGTFGGGVNRFDPNSERFSRIPVATADIRPQSDLITALAVGADGSLWVGTEGAGPFRMAPGTDSLRAVPYANPGHGRGRDNIRALLITTRHDVWIGKDDGLYRYDPTSGVLVRIPGPTSWTTRSTIVTSLLEAVAGRIWIGTYGEGLHQLNTRTLEYSVAARAGERDGISGDRVYRLYRDRVGTFWIGVWGGGVHRVRGLSPLFAVAVHDPTAPGTMTSDDITGIHVDRRGRLLVGTFDGGLNIRERGSTVFHAIQSGPGSVALPSDHVADVTEDALGRIWVGFWDAGLAILEDDRVVARYRTDTSDPHALPSDRIRTLWAEPDGSMWIGSLRGLIHFDGATRTFSSEPVEGTVFALCHTRDGMLWVGTTDGLVEFNPGTRTTRRFRPDPADPDAISHAVIADIFETPGGGLWVATRGGGLNRVHRDPDGSVRFEAITEIDGLADNDAVGVTGRDDVLWISSKNGLSRYHVPTRTFANFREADGLPSGDFANGSILQRNDTLYLGTGRGLIVTSVGGFPSNNAPSPMVVTSLEGTGRGLEFNGAPWATRRVRLHYGDVLSIQFSLLEFGENPNHLYQYRLGNSGGWVDLGGRGSVSFAALSPGLHVFASRGRNQRGIESETPPLIIDVAPPFWMTTWFRLAVVLGGLGIVVMVYRRRTSAILRTNAVLKESRERMRHLAAGIESAREAERTRIAREIHDQFGQTLTSLKLDCQWLRRRDGEDGPTEERLAAMMDLIDATAHEVRRIGAELRPSVLDNLGLAAAVRWQARDFQQRTGIPTKVECNELSLGGDQSTALFRILQEALTNVARHAEANEVHIALEQHEQAVQLRVADNGNGLRGSTPEGKGRFGLIGMQERAETWGGTLRVTSGPGQGTTITVTVPVRSPAVSG